MGHVLVCAGGASWVVSLPLYVFFTIRPWVLVVVVVVVVVVFVVVVSGGLPIPPSGCSNPRSSSERGTVALPRRASVGPPSSTAKGPHTGPRTRPSNRARRPMATRTRLRWTRLPPGSGRPPRFGSDPAAIGLPPSKGKVTTASDLGLPLPDMGARGVDPPEPERPPQEVVATQGFVHATSQARTAKPGYPSGRGVVFPSPGLRQGGGAAGVWVPGQKKNTRVVVVVVVVVVVAIVVIITIITIITITTIITILFSIFDSPEWMNGRENVELPIMPKTVAVPDVAVPVTVIVPVTVVSVRVTVPVVPVAVVVTVPEVTVPVTVPVVAVDVAVIVKVPVCSCNCSCNCTCNCSC